MKDFDFYETVGVIAPGMFLIIGGVLLFLPNQQQNLMDIAKISVGSLGTGVILAFVIGHLLQAFGNILEKFWWWFWGGMPTDWVRSGRHYLIASMQRDIVQTKLRILLNRPVLEISAIDQKDWASIIRQIYSTVFTSAKAARVDIFNANYSLFRGTSAASILLLAGSAIINCRAGGIESGLFVVFALSFYRMHRFAKHYASELFIQYLQLPDASSTGGKA